MEVVSALWRLTTCSRPSGGVVINLRQLRYFVRIVETGSITRAAEQLFVAQPALGQQLRQLEQDLDVSLLNRHSRGISPTKAGQVLYARAHEIFRLIDETQREVTAAGKQKKERISLGLTNGLINFLGRDITLRARSDLPNIGLLLVEGMSTELAEAVERNEIDLAFAYEIPERSGLLRVPLIEEELIFVSATNRGGDASDFIEFSDMLAHPLVLPRQHDGLHQLLRVTAKRLAREPNIFLEISSLAATKDLVAHGDAQSVMPYGSAIGDIERGRLTACRIVNPTPLRTLYMVRSRRRASFAHENDLLDLLGPLIIKFADYLGPLANRLDDLDGPLSVAVTNLEARQLPIS